MGPKSQKRKSMQQESPMSLSDPVNTDGWKCAVVLIVEGSQEDEALTRRFAEEASMNARKEVKSIDFECDVMKVLKGFNLGEISHKHNFLLNFSGLFEEAGQFVKNNESIPVILMVQIIKAMILMLRKEDELERKARMLCRDNPIDMMAAIPLMPSHGTEGTEKDEDKARSDKKKSGKNGVTGLKIKPPTPAKENTQLLRRGEQMRNHEVIDDVPENTFFQLYIALTGFREPELALEMLKNGIPLHGVVCLQSSCPVKPMSLSTVLDPDEFWDDFLRLLWRTDLTHYFRDVVFLVYSPEELPTDEKELRSFICREISFLMYDLSDLKHQLARYLRNMRLWNVDEQPEKIEVDTSELDELPYECMSIPLMVQNMLDALCGEDEEENDKGDQTESSTFQDSSTLTVSTASLAATPDSRTSFTSLAPLTSSVKLPTPRWSTIIKTDEKLLLYNKFLNLDKLYELEDNSDGSDGGMSTVNVNVCFVKKRRLYCENLDSEIENHSEGLLPKLWKNYPVEVKDEVPALNDVTAILKYPDLTINYILYIIWIMQIEEKSPNHESIPTPDSISNISETRFTITDGSRLALHKINRPQNFFSPSQLKIVPSEMLTSVSAPQFPPPPKFSWTEKSFVSDVYIPCKYLQGAPMNVFDDLRNYIGEDAFSRMKDYDFIEELNKGDMARRIQEASCHYDCIRHAYLPLTDCIYVVLYDNPPVNGVQRQVYNVMLTTPVGLRDFYDYILDDERQWLREKDMEAGDGRTLQRCPDSLYNPTPDFREFTQFDFWHEKSIKYMTYEGEIIESVMQRSASEKPAVRRRTKEEKRPSLLKSQSTVYAEPGEPYKFVGFDFEPGAVQYSGVDTTFKGPDNSSVRVSLEERLYGTQQLGVHIRQGGHNLHLYSYVCPQPHLDKPYTCHVEYQNGTVLAFARRVFRNEDLPPEDSSTVVPELFEDEKFAYDMKLSFPHGLTVTTVREHTNPCYIKQSYRKNSSTVALNEKKRLFLPNGSIVKILTNNTVEVLMCDTSVMTASMEDLVLTSQLDSEYSDVYAGERSLVGTEWPHFQSFMKTTPDGYQYTVLNEEITETAQYQILVKAEMSMQRTFYRRMDGVCYVMMADGSLCVEFQDGSKICTYLQEEELNVADEPSWDGEDTTQSVYMFVHKKIVMEHPDYATAIYDTRNSKWKVNLPCKSEIEVDSQGCYQVHLDTQTELDISKKAIRMWRYSPRDELIISTVADLTAFEKELSVKYCTTTDSRGRRFTVESDGSCHVAENDVSNEYGSTSTFDNQSEDFTEPKRYFVVRRDLSGFEIIHTRNVKKEVESTKPGMLVHSQKLNTTAGTRYFALLNEAENDINKWRVDSITPQTKFGEPMPTTSTTYGKPPSWMHPFPKTKPKLPKPGFLQGRIILEIKPTDCPDPKIDNTFAFCDTSDIPPPGASLSDDVTTIMKRVADQDQEILKEIYYAGMRERAQVGKIKRTTSPEMEKYLKMSEYHVQRREHLKQCIQQKKVPGYFDYPTGIAWQIIQTIIKSIITKTKEHKPKPPPVTESPDTYKESSEIEYNLDWSAEPSYSDLSYRSGLSVKTAPEMSRLPIFEALLPSTRYQKSEPAYKMKDLSNPEDRLSYVPGFSFTPPSSENCMFTKEDILTLERKSSSREAEPKRGAFELEDLMNLGLV